MRKAGRFLTRVDQTGVPLLLLRLIIGVFFIYMGVSKASDPVTFLKQIKEYHLLPLEPAILLNATAVTLPWMEIVCGAALVLGVWIRASALTIAGMLAFFLVAIAIRTLAIGQATGQAFCSISFDCGCGAGVVNACVKLTENSLSLIGCILAMASRSRRFCLGSLLNLKLPSRQPQQLSGEAVPD